MNLCVYTLYAHSKVMLCTHNSSPNVNLFSVIQGFDPKRRQGHLHPRSHSRQHKETSLWARRPRRYWCNCTHLAHRIQRNSSGHLQRKHHHSQRCHHSTSRGDTLYGGHECRGDTSRSCCLFRIAKRPFFIYYPKCNKVY